MQFINPCNVFRRLNRKIGNRVKPLVDWNWKWKRKYHKIPKFRLGIVAAQMEWKKVRVANKSNKCIFWLWILLFRCKCRVACVNETDTRNDVSLQIYCDHSLNGHSLSTSHYLIHIATIIWKLIRAMWMNRFFCQYQLHGGCAMCIYDVSFQC